MHEIIGHETLAPEPATGFPGRKLAYRKVEGRQPGLVWMGGFRSDLTSTKAEALAGAAAGAGRANLRFDYTAHGASDGDFHAATLSLWLADSLAMIRRHGGEHPVIVGSSMGGWLALRAAQELAGTPYSPSALVLIAPAVDFTEKLMWAAFPTEIRRQIEQEGVWYRASQYSPEPYPITQELIEDGRRHCLMTGARLAFGMPIHILQGARDPDVPLAHVEAFAALLAEDDVRISLVPDGDHRLSRPEDIDLLVRIALGAADEAAARTPVNAPGPVPVRG